MQYDANKAPNPEEWLALDDAERIDLVIEYHRRHHLPLGGIANLHARAHAMVENQIAIGVVTVVPATLDRLMREGLNRHDAIHAIGRVLIGIIFDAVKKKAGGDLNAKYGRELVELTAASWRSQG